MEKEQYLSEKDCKLYFRETLYGIIITRAEFGENFNGHLELGQINGKDVVKIEEGAFFNCDRLRSIIAPKVEMIEQGAFMLSKNLERIDFPLVGYVGEKAFKDCKRLELVNLPNVTRIELEAFSDCVNLKNIDLPYADLIDSMTFEGCTSLETVELPKVTLIDYAAFRGCTNLKTVYAPNVETISNEIFTGCDKLTNIELPEEVKDLIEEQGKNDKVVNEEINLAEELVEDIEKIDNKINEFFFNYEILKNVNEKDINISEKVIEDAEEILRDIERREKELREIKDKFYNQIDGKNLTEEKDKYKSTADKILEKISKILNYLKEQITLQVNILKERFMTKSENIEESKEIGNTLNISDNDKIKLASMKELPKSMFNYLSESDNPRVLRELALNESLDNEIFIRLSKSNDLKTKEILLENKSVSSDALENLIKDKDDYIKQSAIGHKNLSSEMLRGLYEKNSRNDKILECIAKNTNTPREILSEISKNCKNEQLRDIALNNENHPLKNTFIQPEINKEQNEILYKNLLINSDFRKNEIIEMFKNNEIYADKNGNAIFPIKDSENKLVGAYQIDFTKAEKVSLLENSFADKESLDKVYKLANKVCGSLEQEVIEKTEEMEIG